MIAIVIPYYKLTFFNATLQSLANQTDKRFKVYIGNDASPENPEELLQKYQSSFSFVYHKFETNLGGISLVKQWERCMTMVTDEEWMMILGDDDIIGDNCVSAFYANIQYVDSQQINVIRYATVVVNENNEKLSGLHVHPKLEKATEFLMRRFNEGARSSLSEYIFRKSVMQRIGFKNLALAWYADLLAVLEFSGFGVIYTINDATVYFRISGINITSRNDNLLLKNIASFDFYYYLLKEKKKVFNAEQKSMLMYRLEKTFLDNKKNAYFWARFTKLYISNFYIKKYVLFMYKMLQSILKKANKQ